MLESLQNLIEWARRLSWYEALAISVILFLIGFFGSIAFVTWVLVQMPTTYFQKGHQHIFWAERHPVLRWTGHIAKNLAGVLLVAIGIILSLPGVPGQGVLTILIGIMLLDFPGKRWLERKLVSRPVVFRAVNRLRHRWGKPPFELDASDVGEQRVPAP
jgi:hypothetical protein